MTVPFYFSARAVLVATVAIGAAVAAVHAEPSFQSAFVMNGLTVAFTTAAGVAAIRAAGNRQVFWIGTAAVLACALVTTSRSWCGLIVAITYGMVDYPRTYGDNHFLSWFWCAAPINGALASFLGWVLMPRARSPVPANTTREKPKHDVAEDANGKWVRE